MAALDDDIALPREQGWNAPHNKKSVRDAFNAEAWLSAAVRSLAEKPGPAAALPFLVAATQLARCTAERAPALVAVCHIDTSCAVHHRVVCIFCCVIHPNRRF